MAKLTLQLLSNTRCRLVDAPKDVASLVDDALCVEIPGSRFSPGVRKGLWDGRRHLYSVKRQTFPKGLLSRVCTLLEEAGHTVECIDLRQKKHGKAKPINRSMLVGVTLRPYQLDSVKRAIAAKCGIQWIATNGGKTEIACATIKALLRKRALFLVHKKVLLNQARETIAKRLGLIEEHIGVIGEGRFDPKHITVSTIQALTRRGNPAKTKIIKQYLKTVEQLHVDEGHHTQATTWYRLIQSIDAPWRFIYSGTPFGDSNGLLVEAAVGGVISRISNQTLIDLGVSAKPTIWLVECDQPELPGGMAWPDVFQKGIVDNEHRNRLIAKHAARFVKKNKPVLILVRILRHGDQIVEELKARGLRVLFSHGKMPLSLVDKNKALFESGRVDVLVASTIYDEGVNVPAMRALIIGDGGKSIRSVLQRIGRGLRRKKTGKNKLDVLDFSDTTHQYLAKHSQDRLAIYELEGFRVKTK